MRVRPFIWGWHAIEVTVFCALTAQITQFLPALLIFVLLEMLALRALVIGGFCLAGALTSEETKLTVRRFLLYWWGEFATFLMLYGWYQFLPRRVIQWPTSIGAKHIIFAHGFLCNDGFWVVLAKRLLSDRYSISSVELPNMFSSIETFSDLIRCEIERVWSENSEADITLIGFSMGGLAISILPESLKASLNVVTIYSPFKGTQAAKITGTFRAPNGIEMSPNSQWMASASPALAGFKQAAGFWSAHDSIVLPPWRGKPGINERKMYARGHLFAALDKRLHEKIMLELNRFYAGQSTVMSVSSKSDSNSSLKQSMMDEGV